MALAFPLLQRSAARAHINHVCCAFTQIIIFEFPYIIVLESLSTVKSSIRSYYVIKQVSKSHLTAEYHPNTDLQGAVATPPVRALSPPARGTMLPRVLSPPIPVQALSPPARDLCFQGCCRHPPCVGAIGTCQGTSSEGKLPPLVITPAPTPHMISEAPSKMATLTTT